RLNGKKVKTIKLDANKLTPEQVAALPQRLTQKRGGLDPDAVAGMFGYGDGKAMVEQLIHLQTQVGDTPFKSFVRDLVDGETDRQMERRYGKLDENIHDEAQDHVFSDAQMDLLHELTVARGMKAGSEISFTKEDIQAWARQALAETKYGDVSYD